MNIIQEAYEKAINVLDHCSKPILSQKLYS